MKNIPIIFASVMASVMMITGCSSISAALDTAKETLMAANTNTPMPANTNTPAEPETADAAATITPIRSDAPLHDIEIADELYADEATDHDTPPVSALIPVTYREPTPVTLPGGKLISTYHLHQVLTGKEPPILINALSGDTTELIPGSIWLSGAGAKGRFNDDTQQRLGEHLGELVSEKNKREQMLVFYCTALNCWHSYNAALRAVNLGYRNVHWYRGGLTSWYAAGLPTVTSDDDRW